MPPAVTQKQEGRKELGLPLPFLSRKALCPVCVWWGWRAGTGVACKYLGTSWVFSVQIRKALVTFEVLGGWCRQSLWLGLYSGMRGAWVDLNVIKCPKTVWSWLRLHPHSSSRTRRSFSALSWVFGSRRLGGSGEVSLLAFSSSSSSATSSLDSFSSSWASVHSWGHGQGRKKSVNAAQCPASTLSPITTPRPPQESQPSALCAPHLLPVLRCPRVPQGQSATPAPSHGPYPMGVLAARAEGHEPSTARMNLSLG